MRALTLAIQTRATTMPASPDRVRSGELDRCRCYTQARPATMARSADAGEASRPDARNRLTRGSAALYLTYTLSNSLVQYGATP